MASHYRGLITENETIIPNEAHGKRSYTIKPKALDIVWGGDTRYWRLPKSNDEPAELLQVSWLEVSGSLELKNLDVTTYRLTFEVSMKPDAFGWKGCPVFLLAKVGDGKHIWRSADLTRVNGNKEKIPTNELKFQVTADDVQSGKKLRFGLYEIWKGGWKGGLVIHNIEVKPADQP